MLAAINIAIPITVILFTAVNYMHTVFAWPVVIIALASVVFQVVYWRKGRPKKFKPPYYSLVTLNILYIMLEVVFYSLTSFGIIGHNLSSTFGVVAATTGSFFKFDPEIGVRYVPGSYRIANYNQDLMVFDHSTNINQQGWFSAIDYKKEKNPQKARYMVLGDSYSAGIVIPSPWPDKANLWMEDAGGAFEFLNFSQDGVGLRNWHAIFLKK